MENSLRPWVSWSFLQKNNHQAVKKMERWMIVVLQKTPRNPRSQTIFHGLNIYMSNIYIYI